jgi:hypothetical protein
MIPGRPFIDLEQSLWAIVALRSLTTREVEAIRRAVAARSARWTVEHHRDYDGYLSIIVIPETGSDPSYLISGRVAVIELAEVRDLQLTRLGVFDAMEAVQTELIARLAD